MGLPGFTAEYSLFKSWVHYRSAGLAPGTSSMTHRGLGPEGEVCVLGICKPVVENRCTLSGHGGCFGLDVEGPSSREGKATLTIQESKDWKSWTSRLHHALKLGGHRVLVVDGERSLRGGPSRYRIEFGKGFHGVRLAEIVIDGHDVSATIDGRKVVLPPGANPSSARFETGEPALGARADAGVIELIKATYRQAQLQLASCSPAGAGRHDQSAAPARRIVPEFSISDLCHGFCDAVSATGGSGCGCCADCCAAELYLCYIGAMIPLVACAGAPPCLVAFGVAVGLCDAASSDCDTACYTSDLCCGPPCSVGHETEDCPYPHCSPGAVCCTGPVSGRGNESMCCDSAADCCGGICLEGIYAGYRCVDSGTGANCPPGYTGDICLDGLGATADAGCCPTDRPSCRPTGYSSGPPSICCPAGAGDVCGWDCCPANTPKCANGATCCAATDTVCGKSVECCPAPGVCLGDICCNPPKTPCGGNCCDPAQGEICTPKRNLCCGGSSGGVFGRDIICGNDCCAAGFETCVNGSCCPNSRACGHVCCPPGQLCSGGSCVSAACPAGLNPCQYGPGSPVLCCPPGTFCTDTACCPAGDYAAGTPPTCQQLK